MVDLIPRDVLFGNPERVNPRISPDGTKLAWIAPHEGVLNVWVASMPGAGDRGDDAEVADAEVADALLDARPVTDDRDRGIRMFAWAHDGRHLLYVQDTGGDENWQVHAVDLPSGEHRVLTPFDGVQAQIVALDRHFPNDVLLGLNRDNPQLHDVWHLDLRTYELAKVVENPGYVAWVVDSQLAVRAAMAPTPDGGFVLTVRDTADGEWRPLQEFGSEDALSSGPLSFTLDGKGLFAISSKDADTGRLVRIDTATAATEVLAEDPEADLSGVRMHPDTREPQIAVFARERMRYEVLDPSVQADLDGIRALHQGDPSLAGHDDADATWLVGFTDDRGPVPYYAWDRSTRRGTYLFSHQPALSRYELAAMEPFSLRARDGLALHGYVTFPPGSDRRGVPAVLDVHGGPWARDHWGYNAEAQWLANRGYLCVQVNFRGSTGYGKAFVNAGDREWGGRMHDDLVDTVRFVAAQGWADPSRIGIFGGSYGGYAALVGAAFTPDLFCCAVDIVGPSNLTTLIESVPPYWAPMIAQFHRRVGDPATDAELLWSRSPLSRAGDIRIPLLIAQGANDPRVKQAESEQIVAALEAAGIEHQYLLFPDEGHGFAKPENRLRFYAVAEGFLARHLGGRAEA